MSRAHYSTLLYSFPTLVMHCSKETIWNHWWSNRSRTGFLRKCSEHLSRRVDTYNSSRFGPYEYHQRSHTMTHQRFHAKRKTHPSPHSHIPLPSKFKIFLNEALNFRPRDLLVLIKRYRVTAHSILDHERGKLINRKIQRFPEECIFMVSIVSKFSLLWYFSAMCLRRDE